MPEIPRDPRQLARDILSGKVRIEDIAKERQRAAGGMPPMPQARVPDKIPLPSPPQQRPAPPRPLQRVPAPARPTPQRPFPTRQPPPLQRAPQRPMPPAKLPTPARAAMPAPPVALRGPQALTDAEQQANSNAQMTKAYGAREGDAPAAKTANRGLRIQSLTRNRLALRQGLILSEILNKPLALRDDE